MVPAQGAYRLLRDILRIGGLTVIRVQGFGAKIGKSIKCSGSRVWAPNLNKWEISQENPYTESSF